MRVFLHTALYLLLLNGALFAAGCGGDEAEQPELETDPLAEEGGLAEQEVAVAMLEPTQGNDVRGTVRFIPVDGAVRVTAEVTGLSPGPHGFHIHETGDCSAPDASSAGGHFNPQSDPHGAPENPPGQRHRGDLGNIEAGAGGTATYERVDSLLALGEITGKAVIVHQDQDDLTSQPSGAAGPRLACGVIRMQGETAGMGMDSPAAAPGAEPSR